MRRVDASTLGNWPPGSLGICNCAGMTPCYIRIQLPGIWLKKMMCPECSTPPHPFKRATLPVSASLVTSGHGRSCIWVDVVGNAESFSINIQRGRVAYIHPILPLPHSLLGQPPDATAPTVSGRMYYIAQKGIKAKGHCLDSKVLPSVPIIQAIPFAGDMPSS